MARTLSVPQRGSFAAFGSLEARLSGSFFELSQGRGFGSRGPILLIAIGMTAVGVIVPHLDSGLLSTLFFMAGAGLAALVVLLPTQSPELDGASVLASVRNTRDIPPAFSAETSRQMRFPELFVAARGQSGLDRAAWAKLTAHMSHELRTPLNAVLGFSELMTNEVFGPLGSSYSAYARDIHASGRILLKSAEDALAITAVLTAPERKRGRETACIRAIVDDACAFSAQDLANRSIAVAIDAGCDAQFVGDYQTTRQMLINLVAEATRHAAVGAVLRIETKATPDAVVLSLSLVADGNGAHPEEGFGLLLARTFSEFLGAELVSGTTGTGEWSSTVRLPRVAQADLFAAA
jgi:two-component system cell cycle sensor histidine kinase PleC